jgi:hypothetical protein
VNRLSGRLGLLLLALVLAAYLVLALAPFRWVPPRRVANGAIASTAGLSFPAPGLVRTPGAAPWLERAVALGMVRLALRVRAHDPAQQDTARIFTVSRDYHFRNLTLDQAGPDLLLRLRRPGSTLNGKPFYRLAGALAAPGWHEIEITIAPGRLLLLVDGRITLAEPLPERPLADWDPGYPVVLGNETNGNLPWRGDIALAVVEAGAERVDYARAGLLEVPERYWAMGNRPTWLLEDYAFPTSIEDWIANFVSFIPLGFLFAALGGRRASWPRALAMCALTSLSVEVAQAFFSRHPSTLDWVFNTLGGGAGALVAQWVAGRASGRAADVNGRMRAAQAGEQ